MANKITKVYKNGVAYDIYASGGAAGTGDVTGPSSSTDADIALFDGATGKIIKDSGKKLSNYQTAISDLETIRSGASAGATALQPAAISDTAFGSSWNGDTTHAPSKNAIYGVLGDVETLLAAL